MGWLGSALVLAAAAVSLANPIRRTAAGEASLSTAAFVAILCFAIHGAVDVSGHGLRSVTPALLLLAIASQEPLRAVLPSIWAWPWAFRGIGLTLLATAALWIGETTGQWTKPGELHLDRLADATLHAIEARDFDRAKVLAAEGLKISPVEWELYYLQGQAILYSSTDSFDEAARDLLRARQLNPYDTELPCKVFSGYLRWN